MSHAFHVSRYTMMAEPTKTPELYYTMIQCLIKCYYHILKSILTTISSCSCYYQFKVEKMYN